MAKWYFVTTLFVALSLSSTAYAAKGFKKLRSNVKNAKPSRKILEDISDVEKEVEKEIKDIENKS